MRFGAIYGHCAAMGFSPMQAREMSMWQYIAALDGFIAANSSEEDKKLSADEADDLWNWIEEL